MQTKITLPDTISFAFHGTMMPSSSNAMSELGRTQKRTLTSFLIVFRGREFASQLSSRPYLLKSLRIEIGARR